MLEASLSAVEDGERMAEIMAAFRPAWKRGGLERTITVVLHELGFKHKEIAEYHRSALSTVYEILERAKKTPGD